jgi:hypothetical protein
VSRKHTENATFQVTTMIAAVVLKDAITVGCTTQQQCVLKALYY